MREAPRPAKRTPSGKGPLRWMIIAAATVGAATLSQWECGISYARGKPKTGAHPTLQVQSLPATLLIKDCYDGDTCTGQLPSGAKVKLRLAGIDAPERQRGKNPGQPFATEARRALNSRAQGRTLKVESKGSDFYGRFLAVLYDPQSGENINEWLVKEGWVFAYDKTEWAVRGEREAQKAKRGIWAAPERDRPQNPRLYRRKVR